MNNKEVYKKTLGFSLWRLLWDIISIVIFIAIVAVSFLVADKAAGNGLIGLAVGIILGGIVLYFISRYISYSYKAGQIAMMTKGVSEGKLPEDVIGEGKKIVKKRFTTVAAYFAITNVIKGIFNQIGRAITAVGEAIGGDSGGTVGSAISGVIQTIVAYLCDCCLGWVFYRENEKATKATLEGAVLFFKHGKTLAKNLGRVFGIGALSLLVIGGAFFAIFYLILMNFPETFSSLSEAIAETGESSGFINFLSDTNNLTIACSALGGITIWSIIHSTFIRPFVLVGVLRNYIESGIKNIPTESSFAELDEKSDKFKKLHAELSEG